MSMIDPEFSAPYYAKSECQVRLDDRTMARHYCRAFLRLVAANLSCDKARGLLNPPGSP
jgi:hypothetical protein